MAWRDELRKGTWRGAPFFWNSSETEVGRRNARHDYPLRDDSWFEDLGRCPREFTLEMYVLGPDYMAARDALIDAFEKPGSGLLVHPLYGSMTVDVPDKARIREITNEGGMARFTARFVRSGENTQPAAVVNTPSQVAAKAAAVQSAFARYLALALKLAKLPAYIKSVFQGLRSKVVSALFFIRGLVPTLPAASNFTSGLSGITGAFDTLFPSPAKLAATLQAQIISLETLTDDPLKALALHRKLFDFGNDLPTIPVTTANRALQASNQTLLVNLVRATAVSEACRLAATVDFDNYQAALDLRDELTGHIDKLMESANDEQYFALSDLRSALVQDVTTRAADLARVISHTPAVTMPALYLAHRLYGDATMADDIIARNKARHPGFIPGGAPLEVLTNG